MVENHPNMQKADGFFKGMTGKQIESENKPAETVQAEAKKPESAPAEEHKAENTHSEGHSDAASKPAEDPKLVAAKTEAAPHAVPTPEVKVDAHGAKKEQNDKGGHGGMGGGQHGRSYSFTGEAFVDALIGPIYKEVNKNRWGWRPNDVFKFGLDNVMNYQIGVQEITRQTANILANRIARMGTNEQMNKYLNDAWTCFSIDPTSFLWPAAESEYNKAIDDLNKYKIQLQNGEARFYTRPDNLIPLLQEYSYRLGDCEDKLVDPNASMFETDDRFYYVQGAATVMHSVLEAVSYDFREILMTRYGMDTLKRAIEACEEAATLHPWFIIDADYDGIFANHRANMAAYISHARFYISVLITTLST
jgi:hypothetical protein